MGHWLEEAEKRQLTRDKEHAETSRKENEYILQNHEAIQGFIQKLSELVTRVSHIPSDERKPSIEIGYTHLEGDSKYEFYGSAYMLQNKQVMILFKSSCFFFYWRRIYFNLSDTVGVVKVTIYEKSTSDNKSQNTQKKKIKLLCRIAELDEGLAYHIIDWLTYKISNTSMKSKFPHFHA